MKRISLLSIVLLLTLGNLFAQNPTSVPQLVHYSGTLTASGKPMTEPVGVTFLIYASPAGGEALWMETQEVHPDASGQYSVALGATGREVPADLFSTTEERWLAVQIPGQLESSRQRLISVPYALKAGDAQTLGGLPVSAFALKGESAPAPAAAASTLTSAPHASAAAVTTPNPGTVTSVSLSAPASDFTVTGNPVTKSGTLAFNWTVAPNSSGAANSIVKRDSTGSFYTNSITATGNIEAYGTLQSLGSTSSYGSFLQGTAAKGIQLRNNGVGVDMESLGAPLYVNWVTGQNTYFNNHVGIGTAFPQAELNLNYGGAAIADTFLIGNNTSRGMQMRDTGSGMDLESIGVPLYVNYATRQDLYLNRNGGTVNIGMDRPSNGWFLNCKLFCTGGGLSVPALLNVGAESDGLGNYTSAYFTNDVLIMGNLLVEGTKNFQIDHPLDPEHKTLDHAAIESSEVLNQYSGNVVLDANGQATVGFPEWFAGINTDFRYQLTAIGAPGPGLYIAKEVEGNSFSIAGGQPGSKVSWQVTAKRNDAYMQAHPFQVERMKPASVRGKSAQPALPTPNGAESIAAPAGLSN